MYYCAKKMQILIIVYTTGSHQVLQGDLTFEVSDHTEINNDHNNIYIQ